MQHGNAVQAKNNAYLKRNVYCQSGKATEMKSTNLFAAAAFGLALAAGFSAPAQAQATLNVGVVSDYVFRGISQTNEGGALQGGVEMGLPANGYFGVWGSTVDFGDGTDTEVDVYGGWRPEWMGLTLDIGAIAYRYIGAPDTANWSFYELKLAAAKNLGFATIGGAVFWSPNFTGTGSNEATYYEVNANVPLTMVKNLAITGAYGHQSVEGPGDYNTWNVGLVWRPIPWLELDGRYHDTDDHGLGQNYEERFVGGAKVEIRKSVV